MDAAILAAARPDEHDTRRPRPVIVPNGRMVAGGVGAAVFSMGLWKIIVPAISYRRDAIGAQITILLIMAAAVGQIALGLLWRDHIPVVCRTCHEEVLALHGRWGLSCPRGGHYASVSGGRILGAAGCAVAALLLAILWILVSVEA
jgi:hypothetical protein